MSPISLLVIFIVIGVILLGAEIYVPGGVLGSVGAVALIAAVVVGFTIRPMVGWAAIGGVLVFGVIGAIFWMKMFPRSSAGRRLTLEYDGHEFTTRSDQWDAWVGREGVAQTELRPSGVVAFDGRRVDVIAENGIWIPSGTAVRACRVSGSRLYVEPKDGEET